MASRAQSLFNRIVGAPDPAFVIREMISREEEETEFLDYKSADKIDPNSVKKLWSEALSGFANVEGGVIIWGVDARKKPSKTDPNISVDAPCSEALAPQAAALARMLRELVLQATIDPLEGVAVNAVVSDPATGAGFVVCLIPEGLNKPYRADLTGDRQYRMRTADRFSVIPHSLLRALFHPRLRPRLRVLAGVHEIGGGGSWSVEFRFEICNSGVATAQEIFVALTSSQQMRPTGWNADDWRFDSNPMTPISTLSIRGVRSLHPSMKSHLVTLTWDKPHVQNGVTFNLDVYCSDQEGTSMAVTFVGKDAFFADKPKELQVVESARE